MKVAIVAPYPRTAQAHGEESLGGVASYTKSLVDELRAHVEIRIIAPGMGAPGSRSDGDIDIVDAPRGNRAFLDAVAALARDDPVDVVHVQFEQHLFGGALANLRLLRVLARLRRSKRVIVTLHQVPDLTDIDARFLRENGFPPFVGPARGWMRAQYRLLARAVDHIIVHEHALVDRLVEQYGLARGALGVIPHGVAPIDHDLSQQEAKKRLGLGDEALLLYFGYVTGYKGVDILVDALEALPAARHQGLRAIIAGRSPERKLEKPAFRAAMGSLEARIASLSPWVQRKGFLSQEDIHLHLAAADVVVLPYRQAFGASGPFALAMGQGRPVLVSDAFLNMGAPDDALFARNAEALTAKLEQFLADPALRDSLEKSATRFREERAWASVARSTAACYHQVQGVAT